MLNEYIVKDLIKSLNIGCIENYYVGILDNKKDNSLGIYSDGYSDMEVDGNKENIKRNTMYIRLLWHGTVSPKQTCINAIEIKKQLEKLSNHIRNEQFIYDLIEITKLDVGNPIDVSCDDNGIFERVIHLQITYIN